MYYTTGLSREQITELCAKIHREVAGGKNATWPPNLGLFKSVVVTLTYLRRNRVQQELAETYEVLDSSTIHISRTALDGQINHERSKNLNSD